MKVTLTEFEVREALAEVIARRYTWAAGAEKSRLQLAGDDVTLVIYNGSMVTAEADVPEPFIVEAQI